MSTQKEIKASEVLKMLDNGKTRAEIQGELELSNADFKRLFDNPVLKGKKTKAAPAFRFVDDVTNPNSDGIQDSAAIRGAEGTEEAVEGYQKSDSVFPETK